MTDTMSDALENEFPRFNDGDVLVVLSQSRQYQLHSRTLRLHSAFFRRLLTEERATKLSSKARKEGVTATYRVELRLDNGIDETHGKLVLRVRSHSNPTILPLQNIH